jgi:hypothetical protein
MIFNENLPEIELSKVDISFVDGFMTGEDFSMSEIIRIQSENIRNEDDVVRWMPNEAVLSHYKEEAIRTSRQDTRFDEEILRDDNIICIQANVNVIVDNLGHLAGAASHMATTRINWNPDAPFEVLRNIFENVITG